MRWLKLVAAPVVALSLTGCVFLPGSGGTHAPPKVLVVGDSGSYQFAEGLKHVQSGKLDVVNGGTGGCGVVPGLLDPMGIGRWQETGCPDWKTDWQQLVDRERPDVVLLHVGFVDAFPRRGVTFGSSAADTTHWNTLKEVTRILTSRGAKILWMNVACFDPQPMLGLSWNYSDSRVKHVNDLYRYYVPTQKTKQTLVDFRKYMCPRDRYSVVVNGVSARLSDGIHWTDAGADMVARWLLPQLLALS